MLEPSESAINNLLKLTIVITSIFLSLSLSLLLSLSFSLSLLLPLPLPLPLTLSFCSLSLATVVVGWWGLPSRYSINVSKNVLSLIEYVADAGLEEEGIYRGKLRSVVGGESSKNNKN